MLGVLSFVDFHLIWLCSTTLPSSPRCEETSCGNAMENLPKEMTHLETWCKMNLIPRIQVCPKKGISPIILVFSDGIETINPIWSGRKPWILRECKLATASTLQPIRGFWNDIEINIHVEMISLYYIIYWHSIIPWSFSTIQFIIFLNLQYHNALRARSFWSTVYSP